VIWGALNGLYYLPLMLRGQQKSNTDLPAEGRLFPSGGELVGILTTFSLTLLAWVFFRADSVPHAIAILGRAFTTTPTFTGLDVFLRSLALGALILAVEWLQRDKQHALDCRTWPGYLRWVAYLAIVLGILVLGNFGSTEFIYFQF